MTTLPETIGLDEVLRLTEALADRALSDHLAGLGVRPEHVRLLASVGLVLRAHAIALPPLLDQVLKAITASALRVGPTTASQTREAEAPTSHEVGMSDRDFVEGLYEQHLGRPADPAGLEGWLSAIESGAMDRAAVAAAILASEECRAHARP